MINYFFFLWFREKKCTLNSFRSIVFIYLFFYTEEEPVNEMSSNLLSLINCSPIVLPGPITVVKIPSGNLFCSKTSAITFVTAKVTREVVEAPFQTVRSPQIMAIARFQPKTAQGIPFQLNGSTKGKK